MGSSVTVNDAVFVRWFTNKYPGVEIPFDPTATDEDGNLIHEDVIKAIIKVSKINDRRVKLDEQLEDAIGKVASAVGAGSYHADRASVLAESGGYELVLKSRKRNGESTIYYQLVQGDDVILPEIPKEHVITIVSPMVGGDDVAGRLQDLAAIAPPKRRRRKATEDSSDE